MDWAGSQRILLMQHLQNGGHSLKTFWEELRSNFSARVTAGDLQNFIDKLTGQQITSRGVISAFYCEAESVLTFDDMYDALVCL